MLRAGRQNRSNYDQICFVQDARIVQITIKYASCRTLELFKLQSNNRPNPGRSAAERSMLKNRRSNNRASREPPARRAPLAPVSANPIVVQIISGGLRPPHRSRRAPRGRKRPVTVKISVRCVRATVPAGFAGAPPDRK